MGHLERAMSFVHSRNTIIAQRTSMTSTDVYKDANGDSLITIAKDIGSDLVGLDMGLRQLRSFMGEERKRRENH